MKSAQFITIEGQDGAGKSTNIEIIKQKLADYSVSYVHTREPGGTQFGESIRELILNSNDQQFGDHAELLLMFAARAQHIQEVIEPALKRGDWVLCDRFTDASYAYQGAGRGVSMNVIESLEKIVQGNLQADLTLLLDLPVQVGEQRSGQRSKPDRFEMQQVEFKQRVRDAYLHRAKLFPNRIKVIDANQSFEQVEEQINLVVSKFIQQALTIK